MAGPFALFGRSRELQRFDRALAAAGLSAAAVPEAVKRTALKLLREIGGDPQAEAAAAELLGYCLLGPGTFAEINGEERSTAADARLRFAVDAGDSLDAQLVLLALHAGVIDVELVERYGLEAE